MHPGYSLLELLIVISIISITLAIAIPSQKSVKSHIQDQMISSQLLQAIRLTQTEAMMRQEMVTLKKLPGGWQQGYDIVSETKTLYTWVNKKNDGVLHWRAFPRHKDTLQFMRSGMVRAENGTFWYCPRNAVRPSWAIMLNQSGRARIVYPDKAGEMQGNNPLLC